MTRRLSAFGRFWYDFIIGDDWRVAIGVVGGLALTYGLSATTTIATWWVLPTAVLILLPLSLWRVAHSTRPTPGPPSPSSPPAS